MQTNPWQFSVRRLMVGVALIALLCSAITWLARAVYEARSAARRAQCSGHLCWIALAFHNYHSVYDSFPPAYVADSQGKPMHSWRVLLLPYMEEQALYNAYRFNEPWDGPNNRKLAKLMPRCYTCPNGNDWGGGYQKNVWVSDTGRTNYLAIAGPGTVFPGGKSTSISEVRDGVADTIMLAEIADSGINWLEPRDFDVRTMSFIVNDPSRPSISTHAPGGPYAVCVDGSRPRLYPAVPPQTLKALTTINGGEAVRIGDAEYPIKNQ